MSKIKKIFFEGLDEVIFFPTFLSSDLHHKFQKHII